MEVKYSERPDVRKNDGLYLFAQARPIPDGLVVTKNAADLGPLPEMETDKGRFKPFQIPSFLFLYLLGELEQAAIGGGEYTPSPSFA